MSTTAIRGKQVLDGTIQRHDLDVSTVGQAVVAKLIQGTNISLSSTGSDAGTGDVTVSAVGGGGANPQEVGTIKYWPVATPPTYWLNCDGSPQSRTTYAALYALVGTTYGAGDGVTTFNLPDLRGRVGLGIGQGSGLTNRVLAAIGGEENHVLVTAELAAHVHTITDPGHNHTQNSHNHTQNSHNHTQNSHNHSDAGHTHSYNQINNVAGGWNMATGGGFIITNQGTTSGSGNANIQAATATNVAVTATNIAVTATNIANTTGITGTDSAGSDNGHNNMPPFLVINYIIKAVLEVPLNNPVAPIASPSNAGLVNAISGNLTDYIGGDNACHPIPGGQGTTTSASFTIAAIGSANTIAVANGAVFARYQSIFVAGGGYFWINTILGNTLTCYQDGTASYEYAPGTVVPSGSQIAPAGPAGIAKTGTIGLLGPISGNATDYVGGDNACYPIGGIKNYYGTDTTNSGAYAVTVASDFVLQAGVTVWVTPSNANSANPTLNVNGTGALALVNRASVALFANEIFPTKTFGAVYDGAVWKIFTTLGRYYAVGNTGTVTIECAGFDSVSVWCNQSTNTSINITLAHLGWGVPLNIKFYNGYTAAITYQIHATNPAGTTAAVLWIWANATAGAAAVNLAVATSLTNGNNLIFTGALMGVSEVILL
jgi:microcystin-dependent protein